MLNDEQVTHHLFASLAEFQASDVYKLADVVIPEPEYKPEIVGTEPEEIVVDDVSEVLANPTE